MGESYPRSDSALIDADSELQLDKAISVVKELRGWRDRVSAQPGAVIPARLEADGYERTVEHIARMARVEWSDSAEDPIAQVPVPGGKVAMFASESVDLEAGAKRIARRREKLEAEIGKSERKLANEGFLAKAPGNVVEAERAKVGRLKHELEALS